MMTDKTQRLFENYTFFPSYVFFSFFMCVRLPEELWLVGVHLATAGERER